MTDIISIDGNMTCPESHPESFLYDIWPGIPPIISCGIYHNIGVRLYINDDDSLSEGYIEPSIPG